MASMMKRLDGIAASRGIAVGAARILESRLVVTDRAIPTGLVAAELERFDAAVGATEQQLVQLGRELAVQHLREGQLILEAHRMILRSGEVVERTRRLIAGARLAAESAVRRVIDELVATFDQLDDPYLKERSGDVEAVGERILELLLGSAALRSAGEQAAGAIGVAGTLSPIDAFHLHRAGLSGIATERGGKTSHAAILVRALELPFVVGVKGLSHSVAPGDTLIVDGERGEVIINPDAETLMLAQTHRRHELARVHRAQSWAKRPAATRDGVRVEIGANVETLSEVARAVDSGAESVGLFRTEFLYLDRPDLPTEEEQYQDAVSALKSLAGRMATFRTLDLGGEKLPLAVKIPSGPNPSLGVRAIRFSLRRPDIFRTQLRALYRAAATGPLRIMFPLISGVDDLHEARRICAEVREELEGERLPYNPQVPLGAMIETPSAALTTDHLAELCDFLSIGTNDLIQYAFAADRENEDVYHLYQPLHPAVLRLIKYAVDAAVLAGKPISVCGDMAGDPAFTSVLLGLGVRELSMTPRCIPEIKAVVTTTHLAEAQQLAAQSLLCRSHREVEELVGTTKQTSPVEAPETMMRGPWSSRGS